MSAENGDEPGVRSAGLAPVTPLFGDQTVESIGSPSERHPAFAQVRHDELGPTERPRLRAVRLVDETVDSSSDDSGTDSGEQREHAEAVLLRRLRMKSLSVAEARLLLRAEGAAEDDVEDIVDECIRRGYLNDAVLAEMLIRVGIERKNQGRAAIARTMTQRGLARNVIDQALIDVPDDDAERALEYARSKARSLGRIAPDAALRRLLGQLARRGFSGSVAMQAAKTALREASGPTASGVRFRESE